jgi:hypothetical protein
MMSDALDRILSNHAASTALADDGFSARVQRALPARAAPRLHWIRPMVVLGSTALGAALAIALSPAAGSLLEGFNELARLRLASPAAISAVAISCALLVSAVIMAVDTD